MAQTINVNTPSYTNVTFNASNFGASGGTFTATSTSVNRYKVLGKTLFWELLVEGNTGTTPNFITITLPNSYTLKGTTVMPVYYYTGTADSVQVMFLNATANTIDVYPVAGGTFANATGVQISFNITVEIE